MMSLKKLIIDSFAGGGGASTGIEMALGRSPDIAINHNPAALALHEANHPNTLHVSENVYRVDPLDYLRGQHIGLAWFSPDCKHFSKAKGGKPVERNIRDLAWIIPGWIERIQKSGGSVDVVFMENVEEWKDWGPLIDTPRGLMPCPYRRGETFEKWKKAIRKLGGKIEFRESRACDYGAPTIRKRLMVIIRFDGKMIVWPEPTHGAPNDPDVIAGRKKPWRTAAEIIDWSLPCPSIFDSKQEIWDRYHLRAVRPLADNTMARIARGMKRYVLDADRPFLVNITHGARCEDLVQPLNTITASDKDQNQVAVAFVAQHNNDSRREGGVNPGRDAREPLSTVTGSGSQQGVVSAFISRQFGTSTGHAAEAPLGTVTADGQGKSALIAAHVTHMHGRSDAQDACAPLNTIETRSKSGVVAPFLQKYYGTGDGSPIDEPCHTVTMKDRHGHVEASIDIPPFTPDQEQKARQVADFLRAYGFWDEREFVTLEVGGVTFVIIDIGMRMLTPRELFNAQGFPTDYEIERGRDGQRFSSSVQVGCCGNSVSPPWAQAHVAANCADLMEFKEAAE